MGLYRLEKCEDKVNYFNTTMCQIIDTYLPLKKVVRCLSDKQWITDHFRELIARHQCASKSKQWDLYRHLRNIIDRKTRDLKKKFYQERFESERNPCKLFQGIKAITGTGS